MESTVKRSTVKRYLSSLSKQDLCNVAFNFLAVRVIDYEVALEWVDTLNKREVELIWSQMHNTGARFVTLDAMDSCS